MLVGLTMDTAPMTFVLPVMFLAAGAAVGAVHFILLARDARLLTAGGSIVKFMSLRLARLVATAAVLALAALAGWPSLLAAAVGFLAARQWSLKRFGAVA